LKRWKKKGWNGQLFRLPGTHGSDFKGRDVRNTSARNALIKLLVATMVLAALLLTIFADVDGGLQAVFIIVTVVLAAPIALLIGIDASRTIRRENPAHKSLRSLGRFLAFPQAIFGTVLVGFSVAYPIFGVRELINDMEAHESSLIPLARLLFAAFAFVVGLHYLREGLGLRAGGR
jgi:hypothetical protein